MTELETAIYNLLDGAEGSRLYGKVSHRRRTRATTEREVVYRLTLTGEDDPLTQTVSLTLDFWGYGDDTDVLADRDYAHGLLSAHSLTSASLGSLTGFRQEIAEEVDDPGDVNVVHLHSIYTCQYASQSLAETLAS